MNSETLVWFLLVASVGLNGYFIGDAIKRAMWKRNKRKNGGYSKSGGSNRRPARKRAPRSRYGNWPKGSKPGQPRSKSDDDDDYAPRPGAPF